MTYIEVQFRRNHNCNRTRGDRNLVFLYRAKTEGVSLFPAL
jgi:hypothetical protein